MRVEIACLACSIDPSTASLLVPIAQATIISAPILLRDHIRRGVSAVAARRRGEDGRTGPSGDPGDPTDDVVPDEILTDR